MTHTGPRVLLAAVLLVAGAACTAGDDGAGDDPETDGSASTASPATHRQPRRGREPDEPIPDDAVWVLDDDSLTFVRVDEREVPLSPGQVVADVAYRRADGVTARIVHLADHLGPGGDVSSMETRVLPTEGGATALVPLVGTAVAMVTIAGCGEHRGGDRRRDRVSPTSSATGPGWASSRAPSRSSGWATSG